MMCDIWKREPGQELSGAEWDAFFRANTFLRWITFSGGEPFLRPDIVDIVASAVRHCKRLYYINTPTNSLAPERILNVAEQIIRLPVPEYVLSISLDGPPEVHNRVRGIPTAWDRAMTVLDGARQLQARYPGRFKVIIEHTLLPPSYGRFSEMVDAVRSRFPDMTAVDVMVAGPNVSQHYYGNAAAGAGLQDERDGEMVAALASLVNVRRQCGHPSLQYLVPQYYLELYGDYIRTRKPPMRCRATRSTIFVDPGGVVYPCSVWSRKLGNLKDADYSLSRLFGQLDIGALRHDIDRFVCGGCWTPCEASVSIGENILHPRTFWRLARMATVTGFQRLVRH
jgi:MoaA/NifB/PqqE/SkfB family radical SAM enzyme